MDSSVKTNRGGRPRKPEWERRTRIIQTKLDDAEFESVKRRAEKKGVSVYEYARLKILGGSRSDNRITPEEWALVKRFVDICNELIVLYNPGDSTVEFSKKMDGIMDLKDTLIEKLKVKK